MIHFVTPREQEFGIRDYLESWGRDLAGLVTVLHYEDLPRRPALPAGTHVFLGLDQLTPGGTRLVCQAQDCLRAAPGAGMVLNDPRTTLLRFDLLDQLYRLGLNRHRVVRARQGPGGLRFPVFLREEHEHTGALSPLLGTPAEVERALGRALLQGHRLDDLLLVEYFETADGEGRYRKYSAYRVGPTIIPRGMGRGRDWMLKAAGVDFSEEMLTEERAYALTNPFESQLRRIFDTAGAGFGRIDFAVKDGMVETWEINLNPTIGPGRHSTTPDSVVKLRQPTRELFSRRFQAALEALDTCRMAAPVAFDCGEDIRRGAEPMVRAPAQEGRVVRAARALRPLSPALRRMARFLSPLVARVTRWLR